MTSVTNDPQLFVYFFLTRKNFLKFVLWHRNHYAFPPPLHFPSDCVVQRGHGIYFISTRKRNNVHLECLNHAKPSKKLVGVRAHTLWQNRRKHKLFKSVLGLSFLLLLATNNVRARWPSNARKAFFIAFFAHTRRSRKNLASAHDISPAIA